MGLQFRLKTCMQKDLWDSGPVHAMHYQVVSDEESGALKKGTLLNSMDICAEPGPSST